MHCISTCTKQVSFSLEFVPTDFLLVKEIVLMSICPYLSLLYILSADPPEGPTVTCMKTLHAKAVYLQLEKTVT